MKSLICLIDLVLESQVNHDKDVFMSPIVLHSRFEDFNYFKNFCFKYNCYDGCCILCQSIDFEWCNVSTFSKCFIVFFLLRLNYCFIKNFFRNGSFETGIFCCITLLLERLRSEQLVDVFQTVRSLQRCRPGIITSLVSYFASF